LGRSDWATTIGRLVGIGEGDGESDWGGGLEVGTAKDTDAEGDARGRSADCGVAEHPAATTAAIVNPTKATLPEFANLVLGTIGQVERGNLKLR
jgi:hypothetical protein